MVPEPRFRVVLALLLVSCGPAITVVEGEPDTTGMSAPSSETTSTAQPVTSGPTDPPGSPSTDEAGGGSSGAVADTGTSGEGDEPGCGFLCEPDAPSGSCDLFAQNCPPGEKCMPWADDGGPAWNATRCSPLAKDPTQVGEECMVEGSGVSGIDDCDLGLMCWNVDENGLGVCEDMCTGSADLPICENPEDYCSVSNEGVLALCLTSCHPLLQDCEESLGCAPFGDVWICVYHGGENGIYGDPCEYYGGCDPGNVCIGADAFTTCAGYVGCCSRFCDLNGADADAMCQALDPAQTCEPWYGEGQAPVGYDDVGVCMIAGSL